MKFNTDTEQRDGYTVSHDMKLVWQKEIELLQELLRVCREHGLRCWADGGTLLGAVRHKGFIPWDDDIDMQMPRQDYDRLLDIGATAFREPFMLQSAYSDIHYSHGHAQLRNKQTTAIRPSDSYRPFCQGIFIDIFPLDNVPDGRQGMRQTLWEVHHVWRRLKAIDTPLLLSGRLGLVARKIAIKREVEQRGWHQIFREAEDRLRKLATDDSQCVAQLAFSADDFVFPRSIYSDTVMLPFEDFEIPAPVGYHEQLTIQYGDYMTPCHAPSYHGDILFDTTRPYTELIPQARREYRHRQMAKLLHRK